LGQLGQEPHLKDRVIEGKVRKGYISHLCDIFEEYKDVMSKYATLWVVIDDKYDKMKSLMQVPHRFSIEMADRGWRLISDPIWCKPNAYPESVYKRFSRDQEYVFFFLLRTMIRSFG